MQGNDVKLGLVGPVQLEPLRPWLDLDEAQSAALPPGHGGTPVTQLAVGMLSRGQSLTIVSLEPSIERPSELRGAQLRLMLGPYRPAHRSRDAFRAERHYIRDALRKDSPDVVHAHWTYEYALGALASARPTLVTVRDWAPTILRLQPDPYRLARLAMSAVTLTRGRWFTVTSPYMRERLERWGRRPMRLIPNAVGDGAFAVDAPIARPSEPTILAINNGFSRRKNVTVLLDAFQRVRTAWPSSTLSLVGIDYEPGGRAHSWAASRDLLTNVRFLGPVRHARIAELLRRATIFVHPALEESFGLVLVEAMAQRTPVIGGRSSGAVPWVLGDGSAGLLVDVTDPHQLAEAMRSLLADSDLRDLYSEAGFRRAWDNFRVATVLDQYEDCYRSVLAEAGT